MSNCANCHAPYDDGARYCASCGATLEAPRPVDGERKFATVLFADVARSTALAERLDPEDWAAIMNGAFGFMNAAVARYGGTVARLMGDAVLAFFGAPVAHEDDPERAVRAALDIRDAAADYSRTVSDRFGVDFGIRVGVNSGVAVLAMLGDRVKAEYTAMGDTANVAARLQSKAETGTVLISGETARLVRGLFELRPHGSLDVRGRRASVDAFEVVAALASPGKRRGLEGLHSPLVGRKAEHDRLCDALEALADGRGGVVAVTGEAGLGKSRLMAELREEAERMPTRITWLEGRAVSYGESLVYYPWQQIGRQFIQAAESDTPEVVRDKVQRFAGRVGAPAEAVPLYNAMLAVETEADRRRLASLEGDAQVKKVAEAVVGAIRAAMVADGAAPCVIVFDDLHWSDAASIDLIAGVAELTASDALLLICVTRPDPTSPAWSMLERLGSAAGDRFTRIELQPLDGSSSDELLRNLLKVDALPDGVRSVILARSEGNPFFLEEVLRGLVDAGQLEATDDGWRTADALDQVAIPETLIGVLTARIDALPAPAKRVVQTAAVLGRIFPYQVLDAVCAAAPPPARVIPIDPHLETLLEEELIREQVDGDREFIFKHALTQESAYGSLLNARRRELHALAGDCLEELYPDRLEELAPLLAYHFERGGQPLRTARYSMRAAERALRLFAVREAISHYDRAHQALTDAADAPAGLRIDAILGWVYARYKLADYDGALERLQEAETLARDADDRRRLAQALSWTGTLYMLLGRPSQATPYLIQSNELGRELGDVKLMLLPFFYATDELLDRDPRKAAEQLERVIELARRYRVPEIEGHALAVKAVAHARIGEFDRAREFIDQALVAAPSGGHKVKEADVHILVGAAYHDLGDMDKAFEHARIGTELAQAENAIECACAGYYGVGLSNLERKEPSEAVQAFSRSLEYAEDSGWYGFVNRIRGGLAAADSGDEAIREMERAIDAAHIDGDGFAAAIVAERLADVHLERGEVQDAEDALAAALAYYRDTGMRAYEARALDASARIQEALDRPEQAAADRSAGRDLRARFETPSSTEAAAGSPRPVSA